MILLVKILRFSPYDLLNVGFESLRSNSPKLDLSRKVSRGLKIFNFQGKATSLISRSLLRGGSFYYADYPGKLVTNIRWQRGVSLGEIIELNIVLRGVGDTFVLNLEGLGFRLGGVHGCLGASC